MNLLPLRSFRALRELNIVDGFLFRISVRLVSSTHLQRGSDSRYILDWDPNSEPLAGLCDNTGKCSFNDWNIWVSLYQCVGDFEVQHLQTCNCGGPVAHCISDNIYWDANWAKAKLQAGQIEAKQQLESTLAKRRGEMDNVVNTFDSGFNWTSNSQRRSKITVNLLSLQNCKVGSHTPFTEGPM